MFWNIQDGHHPIIFMQCGPIRYKVDARIQAEKRAFSHYMIPRFTEFRVAENDIDYQTVCAKVCTDEKRNKTDGLIDQFIYTSISASYLLGIIETI